MNKKTIITSILLLVLLLNTAIVWGSTDINIPHTIKIGLRHGEKSPALINLYSANGFELGYYDKVGFLKLISLMENENIIVRKDSYFINLNKSYIEVYPDYIDNNSADTQGPYHVQFGIPFSSKDEMLECLDELQKNSNINFYPVYEDGWRIWTGLFVTEKEAVQFINENSSKYNERLTVIKPNDKRVQVLDDKGNVLFLYDSSDRDYHFRNFLEKDSNNIISVDGKRYRGEIIVKRYQNSDLTIINFLTLQEYLYGVLPKEMSGEWPVEALKAQAVAARNFAIANINKHGNHGFDLCSTIDCQVYGGFDAEKPRCNRAVDETEGKIITYNGKIISAFFHSNSGGHTEDSENIWNISLPYIRGVEDDFSLEAPNSNWTQVYSASEIKDILNKKGLNVGNIKDLYPEKYSENGRVLMLKIKGTEDEITLQKEKTRAVFGYNNVKSMCFNVSTDIDLFIKSGYDDKVAKKPVNRIYVIKGNKSSKITQMNKYSLYNGERVSTVPGYPSKYIFHGKGWGHGLGMSQWGAKKMAELGYTYEQILKHYYTGVNLE